MHLKERTSCAASKNTLAFCFKAEASGLGLEDRNSMKSVTSARNLSVIMRPSIPITVKVDAAGL